MALRTKSSNEKSVSTKQAVAQEDMKVAKFKAMVKETDRYLVELSISHDYNQESEYESKRPNMFHYGLYLYTDNSKTICIFKYVPSFLDKYRQVTFIKDLLLEIENSNVVT